MIEKMRVSARVHYDQVCTSTSDQLLLCDVECGGRHRVK